MPSDQLMQVLGASADAIEEALSRYTEYRRRNVRRILERAAAKSGHRDERAAVNLRVAHVLLEDGSYCDDELIADYLGGLLAGSRTQQERDDRAVAWSNVLTSLSSLQIRAHYLLYREWAARLSVVAVFDLGLSAGRIQATMDVSSKEFAQLLVANSLIDANDAMSHAIGGLIRVSLLDNEFFYNDTLLRVTPSITGIELYGWAQGLSGVSPRSFAAKARPFDLQDAIPRLRSVTFPKLPERAEVAARTGRKQISLQQQSSRAKRRSGSDSEPEA